MIGTASTPNSFILRYQFFVALYHVVSGEIEGECLLQQQLKQGRVQPEDLTSEVAENFCKKGILQIKEEGTACCDSTCGECGGADCAERPGGQERCCGGAILKSGKVCTSADDVACVVKPLPDQEQSESFKVDDYILVTDSNTPHGEWVGTVTSVDPLQVDGKLVNKVADSDLIILPITKAPTHFKICHGSHALDHSGTSGSEMANCFRVCGKDPKCTHFTIFHGSNGCRTFSDCSKTGVTGDGYEGPRTFAMTRAPVQSPDMTQVIGKTARYRCNGKPSEKQGNLGKGMSSFECRQACMGSTSCKAAVYHMPKGTCTQWDACDKVGMVKDGPFNNWRKEASSPTDAPPAPVDRPTGVPVPVDRPTGAPTSPTDTPVVSPTEAPPRPTPVTDTPVVSPTEAPPGRPIPVTSAPAPPQNPPRRRRAKKPRSGPRRRMTIRKIVKKIVKEKKAVKKLEKRVQSLEASAK